MRDAKQVIHQIQSLLSGKSSDTKAASESASQYAAYRQQAAKRLKECADLLAQGQKAEAVRLAEAQPALLDSISKLSFPEEAQWTTYCQKNGLEAPPALDKAAVAALQEAIQDTRTPEQLWRDYRAAVFARDEDRALGIIQAIVRVNPSDANALVEKERQETKRQDRKLAELKSELERGDRETITATMEALDKLGAAKRLGNQATYQAGAEIRQEARKERAEREANVLLAEAQKDAQAGRWPGVAEKLRLIQALEKEHALVFPEAQSAARAALEHGVKQAQAEQKAQSEFEAALGSLMNFVDRVQAKLANPGSSRKGELEKLQSSWANFAGAVEKHQRPIPHEKLERLQTIHAALQQQIQKQRFGKNLLTMSLVGAFLTLAALLGWFLYLSQCAKDYIAQLQDARDHRTPLTAQKLVAEIRSTHRMGLTWFGALPEKMRTTELWAQEEVAQIGRAERELAELEQAGGKDFQGSSPQDLHSSWAALQNRVTELTPEGTTRLQERLNHLQKRLDSHFATLREQTTADMQRALNQMQSLVPQLDFKKPSSEIEATLAQIKPLLREAEEMEKSWAPEMRPTQKVEESYQQLSTKWSYYFKQLNELKAARDEVEIAITEAGYKSSLAHLAQSPFAEVDGASQALAQFPQTDALGAKLLFDGDVKAWTQAKEDARGAFYFHPAAVEGDELQRMLSLRDDPKLNDYAPARKLLSALRLDALFSPQGDKYLQPLFDRIDAIARLPEGDPMVKAYLIGRMFELVKPRALQWGLQYCPALQQDMTDMASLLENRILSSSDCTTAGIREKYVAKLKSFFVRVSSGAAYLDQAKGYQSMISQVARDGITFAGHLDENKTVHLNKLNSKATTVWGISAENGKPLRLTLNKGQASAAALASVLRWSPLYDIPFNPGAAFLQAHRR